MKLFSFLFAFLFFVQLDAQTYYPTDGKIVITYTTEQSDGSVVTMATPKLDTLEGANRFFNSMLAANERIAQMRIEIDELERQVRIAAKSYRDLSGQNAEIKVADMYGAQFIGQYSIVDTTSTKACEVRLNAQGRLVLRIGTTNHPISVLSPQYIKVANLTSAMTPTDFILVNGILLFSERGRKISLIRKL